MLVTRMARPPLQLHPNRTRLMTSEQLTEHVVGHLEDERTECTARNNPQKTRNNHMLIPRHDFLLLRPEAGASVIKMQEETFHCRVFRPSLPVRPVLVIWPDCLAGWRGTTAAGEGTTTRARYNGTWHEPWHGPGGGRGHVSLSHRSCCSLSSLSFRGGRWVGVITSNAASRCAE